jgi:hypothetical protein
MNRQRPEAIKEEFSIYLGFTVPAERRGDRRFILPPPTLIDKLLGVVCVDVVIVIDQPSDNDFELGAVLGRIAFGADGFHRE